MESFLSFPPEIQTHVLCFLSQRELTFLFDLECLFKSLSVQKLTRTNFTGNELGSLEQQALFAMFHRKPLLLSNEFASKSMPLCHLRALIDLGVHITPSEVNIHVHDFTDYDGSFSIWDCFSPSLFQFLLRLSSNINVELVVWEDIPLDPDIMRAWFKPLIEHGIALSSCKIRHLSVFGLASPRPTEVSSEHRIVKDIGTIKPMSLYLNFLGPFEAFRSLASTGLCISLDNIRCLDLSYNQLSDMEFRSLRLPGSLEELNLSNNSMSVFDSESFPFEELPLLKSLDLSNNNIMRLDICQPRADVSSSVKRLNLSGNFLCKYSQLFSGHIFANLEELDLSHNLISQVSTFSMSMKSVNLAGNYITTQPGAYALYFPKSLEILGIDQLLVRDLHEANGMNNAAHKL
ncbi:outer arm dynein light chain 1 [Metschnikowia bicuspidata var. bicuspidata NRRL YB-4993]|uniref:Outer arm dynein light chain 1 n=1 Tax=Metschnikowia bicuspidata var. bicuspidata NRRL YB-4993 TaxID=869754 RepID=A0A1A0H5U4_9ASCO|nr:outer arm dynein light chain 1 [Metschnikowia bicuspidata var. bicuspidata NRRL YB-4993]OBA19277.1 outer arm dynein light chain 1 [Metschnikowia bicuspidata var. bicuspidata NRRL YB-4993]